VSLVGAHFDKNLASAGSGSASTLDKFSRLLSILVGVPVFFVLVHALHGQELRVTPRLSSSLIRKDRGADEVVHGLSSWARRETTMFVKLVAVSGSRANRAVAVPKGDVILRSALMPGERGKNNWALGKLVSRFGDDVAAARWKAIVGVMSASKAM